TAEKWYEKVKDGPAFTFMGDLDAKQRVVNNAKVAVGGRYGTLTFTSSVSGKSSDSPAFLGQIPEIGKLKFDSDFTIQAGHLKREWNNTIATLEWDAIPAKHLPNAESLAQTPPALQEFVVSRRAP